MYLEIKIYNLDVVKKCNLEVVSENQNMQARGSENQKNIWRVYLKIKICNLEVVSENQAATRFTAQIPGSCKLRICAS